MKIEVTSPAVVLYCEHTDSRKPVDIMVPEGQVKVGDKITIVIDRENVWNLEIMETGAAEKSTVQ
jgi:hypothetical protein